MQFKYLVVLLLIPIILWLIFRPHGRKTMAFSDVRILPEQKMTAKIKMYCGRVFFALGMIAFVVALARPQIVLPQTPSDQEGIDMALLLDVSQSMESVDIEPNRLEVARTTIDNFIDERHQDRLALVVFSGSAYTRIPLTLDHDILKESLQDVNTNSVGEQGTAIGMSISVGMNRLKKSDSSSKVMILVTDGDNNAGSINPMTAAQLAKELGIKIYTIGVGTDQTIIPVQVFGQTTYQTYEGGLDEGLLQDIAEATNGKYYRAKDEKALEQIFDSINTLETTSFEEESFNNYDEAGFLFIKIGLICLLLGILFHRRLFIQIP